MVPVSTRAEDERGKMGNKVSAMFLELATNVEDPIERLKLINAHSQESKAFEKAGTGQALVDLYEFIPFGLATRMTRLYSLYRPKA